MLQKSLQIKMERKELQWCMLALSFLSCRFCWSPFPCTGSSSISRSERALTWWEGIKGVSLLLPSFSLDNIEIYLDRAQTIPVPQTNLLTLGVANLFCFQAEPEIREQKTNAQFCSIMHACPPLKQASALTCTASFSNMSHCTLQSEAKESKNTTTCFAFSEYSPTAIDDIHKVTLGRKTWYHVAFNCTLVIESKKMRTKSCDHCFLLATSMLSLKALHWLHKVPNSGA